MTASADKQNPTSGLLFTGWYSYKEIFAWRTGTNVPMSNSLSSVSPSALLNDMFPVREILLDRVWSYGHWGWSVPSASSLWWWLFKNCKTEFCIGVVLTHFFATNVCWPRLWFHLKKKKGGGGWTRTFLQAEPAAHFANSNSAADFHLSRSTRVHIEIGGN